MKRMLWKVLMMQIGDAGNDGDADDDEEDDDEKR
jgi:hypothetical protein